jgi:uncharacterized membrane protein
VSIVSGTIEVEASLPDVYRRWTRFEDFPTFMEGVESVRQLTENTLEWTTETEGRRRTWTAWITERVPDRRIAWASERGEHIFGTVEVVAIRDGLTQVSLTMRFADEDSVEIVSDQLSVVENRVNADLARFKRLVEARGLETGASRGDVPPRGARTDE